MKKVKLLVLAIYAIGVVPGIASGNIDLSGFTIVAGSIIGLIGGMNDSLYAYERLFTGLACSGLAWRYVTGSNSMLVEPFSSMIMAFVLITILLMTCRLVRFVKYLIWEE